MDERRVFNRRAHERFALQPMYAAVRAQRASRASSEALHGHAYDVSEGGVKVELDDALEPGEPLSLQLSLPGAAETVNATATVVWMNDAVADLPPRQMALRFTDFVSARDRERLLRFMSAGCPRLAA